MDKTAQNDQTQVQTVASPSQTWQGSVQKEQGPVVLQEHLVPSETEPEIHPELTEAGVEVLQKSQVGQDVIKIGLEPAKEEVKVETEPSGLVKLPMTEEEAKKIIKVHKKVSDSVLWLAMEIVRQFKMFHGKIVK